MTGEWIQFILTAVFLVAGVAAFAVAVLGANRFEFVMNRMHSAGIGDTIGLLFVILAGVIFAGWNLISLKLILVLMFMWFSSPASTHFLGQVEYYTNPHLYRFTERRINKEDRTDGTD